MATFPTLTPSTRTCTPGKYPHSAFAGMSGVQNRVRNSNVMLNSQLRLTFTAITESQMLSILTHYQGRQGTFQSFPLPTAIWSGVSSINDYQLSGYGWRYIEPPSVTDAMCANAYDVELTLETVPPEGTALLGLNSTVRFSIDGGTAQAANGAILTVTTLIEYGAGVAVGLSESATWTLAPGTFSSDSSAPGSELLVTWVMVPGAADGGGSGGGDPDFANVSLLLHMDGSNGSTTFTDSSSNNHAMSIKDGTVTITTSESKFGGASANFTAGGDLRTPTSTAFTFNANFTVELWARRTGTTANVDTVLAASSETNLMMRPSTSNPGFFFNGVGFANSFAMPLNTWQHLAMVRNGSTVTAYQEGVSIGTTTSSATVTCNFLIFGDSSVNGRYFRGQIDEVRVTKGVARYTANFTPPTAPFPDS